MKNKGLIIFTILLILCIIGLVFYILVDKKIIKLNNTVVKNEQVEKNNTNNDNKDESKEIAIDINNENIITLFNNAHHISIGPESQIYRDGGYSVNAMSIEDKMLLLASQWSSEVESQSEGISPNLTTTYYLDEDTLKNLYERTFGPNTYKQVNQITDGCLTLNYDATNKRYSYVGTSGCGGTSTFSAHEKIISATKSGDRIKIVSAVFYLDPEGIYKDYNKTTVLGEDIFYNNNYTTEEIEKLQDQYIDENKDKLEQYTYTYILNDDGFYYLDSVERTKS